MGWWDQGPREDWQQDPGQAFRHQSPQPRKIPSSHAWQEGPKGIMQTRKRYSSSPQIPTKRRPPPASPQCDALELHMVWPVGAGEVGGPGGLTLNYLPTQQEQASRQKLN